MEALETAKNIIENIEKVIVGKGEKIFLVLTAIVAGGHILAEDVPGTGKTVMAKSLAKSIDCKFSRIQFTPDLLPTDITGINFYNNKTGEFEVKKGPVFTNILLADEINRATPRTQSGLLECMEEGQATVDGETFELSKPFIVIATQNPVETAGTFPLPEAQLDRFLIKITPGLPSVEEEINIMNRFLSGSPAEKLEAVCSGEDIITLQNAAKEVYIHPELIAYIAEIISKTRNYPSVALGVSTRGTLGLLNACRAYALLSGREYVTADDIKTLAPYVLSHRLMLKSHNLSGEDIIKEILNTTKVPTEEFNVKEDV